MKIRLDKSLGPYVKLWKHFLENTSKRLTWLNIFGFDSGQQSFYYETLGRHRLKLRLELW